jgi:hypothetical protein
VIGFNRLPLEQKETSDRWVAATGILEGLSLRFGVPLQGR